MALATWGEEGYDYTPWWEMKTEEKLEAVIEGSIQKKSREKSAFKNRNKK